MDNTYGKAIRLREMASDERPQERLEKHGAQALSDTELLAMLLRSGSVRLDVIGLSQHLIHEAGSLSGLLSWTAEDFQRMPGIGKVKALQLLTVMEVARRILTRRADQHVAIDHASKVYEYMLPRCAGLEVEKFWALCLNRKHLLLKCVEVTSGTANASLVHPREVFREAIRLGASAVIAAHNHPSGDPSPSDADTQITEQLSEASKIIGIKLLDHVIIGQTCASYPNGYYSFSEANLLA